MISIDNCLNIVYHMNDEDILKYGFNHLLIKEIFIAMMRNYGSPEFTASDNAFPLIKKMIDHIFASESTNHISVKSMNENDYYVDKILTCNNLSWIDDLTENKNTKYNIYNLLLSISNEFKSFFKYGNSFAWIKPIAISNNPKKWTDFEFHIMKEKV